MPKAKDVAIALRELADRFDSDPEADVQKPDVWWFCNDKESFKRIVKFIPRPLAKRIDDPNSMYPYLIVDHKGDGLHVEARITQSKICHIVEPARPAQFECEPILSAEEENDLTEAK